MLGYCRFEISVLVQLEVELIDDKHVGEMLNDGSHHAIHLSRIITTFRVETFYEIIFVII